MASGDGGSGAAARLAEKMLDVIQRVQKMVSYYNTQLHDLEQERDQLQANQLGDVAAHPAAKEKLQKVVKDEKTCRAKREKALHLSQLLRKSLVELSTDPEKTAQFFHRTEAGEELDCRDVGRWLPMSDSNFPRLYELFTEAEACVDEILSMIPEDDDEEKKETVLGLASELLVMLRRHVECSLETPSFDDMVKKGQLKEEFDATGDPLVEEKLKKAAEVDKRREELTKKARNQYDHLKESFINLSHNPSRMTELFSYGEFGKEDGLEPPINDDKVRQLLELRKEIVACLNEFWAKYNEGEEEEAVEEEMVAKTEAEEEERRKKQKMDEKINEEDEDINNDDDLN